MAIPEHFAQDWIDAWNRHDLDAILSHYDDDIAFTSPFVIQIFGEPSGTLRGKAALRDYFGKALSRFPDLKFELIRELRGVDSVVLHYHSVKNLLAAEVMTFGAGSKVVRVSAHYSDAKSGG